MSVLTLRIVDPWLIVSLCAASAAAVVFLLLRRRPAPWPLWAAAAFSAGWQADSDVVPGAGHVVDALEGGLAEGFARLYPRLGLSAP
ncbi:hypothetical protein [Microbacterium sp. AG790]|uniref:hypothetical protein n=1 Tax=Microbacterium sp. AG790 TaxID=2183995 RepID=UPI00217DF52C|nr:hypothetical protein [Microbacterium sp. AG790]